MAIVNRRNAVVGWFVVKAGKEFVGRKAKQAVPGTVSGTHRPNKPAIVAGVAALGSALLVWRRVAAVNGSGDEPSE
jgi:hypothetical protein